MAEIVFLLGAGASRDAGLPLMDDLTSGFHEWLLKRTDLEGAVNEFAALFDAAVDIAGGKQGAPNIELVLSFLNMAAAFKNDQYAKAITGWSPPFQGSDTSIKSLIALIQDYIHDRLRTFDPLAGNYLSGILDFQSDKEALDVFTLNYDRLVESMAPRYGVRFTTGFGDVWDPGLFDQTGWNVRVFKLHGSIDWYRVSNRSIIYQGAREHYAFRGETTGELLLYPAEAKVSHAEPYATLMAHFTRALAAAQKCIAVGYSFRDRDIKRIVLDRMATNRALQLLVVNPDAQSVLYQPPDAADEPTFSDFPDRVIGLWKGAKESLENRMIRFRLVEIEEADYMISQIRDQRNGRRFQDASSALLNLIEKCRSTQMPGKPIPSLALTDAPEFRAKLQFTLKRVLRWLLDPFGGPPQTWVSVPVLGLSYNRGGAIDEAFGMLVSLWLLAEALRFEDEATEARNALRKYLAKLVGGLLFTRDSGYEGWPVEHGVSADRSDRKLVEERADATRKLSNELEVFPPLTALRGAPDSARAMYKALKAGLVIVAESFERIRDRGIQKLQSHQGAFYTPNIDDWQRVAAAEPFDDMAKAWAIDAPAKADLAALRPINAT